MESKFYRPSTVGGGPRTFKGKIKEIIVFTKDLSDQEMVMINYYLSTKWGLESTVDSDGDGLVDQTEATLGSNPLNEDSDGDGTLDELDVFPMDALSLKIQIVMVLVTMPIQMMTMMAIQMQ